jgi:hypothetical protein
MFLKLKIVSMRLLYFFLYLMEMLYCITYLVNLYHLILFKYLILLLKLSIRICRLFLLKIGSKVPKGSLLCGVLKIMIPLFLFLELIFMMCREKLLKSINLISIVLSNFKLKLLYILKIQKLLNLFTLKL